MSSRFADEGYMQRTPVTWGELEQPTPEQLAEWLSICSKRELVGYAESSMAAHDRAGDSFIRNYPQMEDVKGTVESAMRALADAVRAANPREAIQAARQAHNSLLTLREWLRAWRPPTIGEAFTSSQPYQELMDRSAQRASSAAASSVAERGTLGQARSIGE